MVFCACQEIHFKASVADIAHSLGLILFFTSRTGDQILEETNLGLSFSFGQVWVPQSNRPTYKPAPNCSWVSTPLSCCLSVRGGSAASRVTVPIFSSEGTG